MKYLFAAIDARQSRLNASLQPNGHGHARASRPKYNAIDLKKLLVDASDGVQDEKTSTHDFVSSLERIVNEIKNTTEHSGAFLQKVKKTEVADYYDVIKKPMDLATLLKRVKQQTYRSKKAFADDLDLIWSNCLLYNSHPSHPLRRSAEFLRAKSNSLLEFISDPALPTRSLYVSAVQNQSDRRRKGTATPAPEDGDEDGDLDPDSEEDDSRAGHRGHHGMNGDGYEDTASPSGSRDGTPMSAQRKFKSRFSRASRSPSEQPPPASVEAGFEEEPAIIRTSDAMSYFSSLDATIARLDQTPVEDLPVASTSTLTFLPPPPPPPQPIIEGPPSTHSSLSSTLAIASANDAASTPETTPAQTPLPFAHSPRPNASYPSNSKLAVLVQSLASSATEAQPVPDEPPDVLWWQTVSSLSGPALASGLPACGFVDGPPIPLGHSAPPLKKKKLSAKVEDQKPLVLNGKGAPLDPKSQKKVKGKGREIKEEETPDSKLMPPVRKSKRVSSGLAASAVQANEGSDTGTAVVKVEREKKPKRRRKPVESASLAQRMERNVETLREVKRLHHQVGTGATSSEGIDPSLAPLSDFDDADSDYEECVDAPHGVVRRRKPVKPRRPHFGSTGVSAELLLAPATAPDAARHSMTVVSERVLSHAGFDSSAVSAVGVLAHVAAEYIINLGRTLRFYADNFGAEMTNEQIMLHVLSENGVASPSDLKSYVAEDVDEYGQKLADLHSKLKRARKEQLDELEDVAGEDEQFFGSDNFELGEFSRLLGEDFFGLAEIGLEREASLAATIPMRLLRGEAKDASETSSLRFPPPPPHIPLTSCAADNQIGLLRPFLLLRQKTEAGLVDDVNQPVQPRSGRPKIAPTGRIPVKAPPRSKRKVEDAAAPTFVAKSKKKKAVVEAQKVESDL